MHDKSGNRNGYRFLRRRNICEKWHVIYGYNGE